MVFDECSVHVVLCSLIRNKLWLLIVILVESLEHLGRLETWSSFLFLLLNIFLQVHLVEFPVLFNHNLNLLQVTSYLSIINPDPLIWQYTFIFLLINTLLLLLNIIWLNLCKVKFLLRSWLQEHGVVSAQAKRIVYFI